MKVSCMEVFIVFKQFSRSFPYANLTLGKNVNIEKTL